MRLKAAAAAAAAAAAPCQPSLHGVQVASHNLRAYLPWLQNDVRMASCTWPRNDVQVESLPWMMMTEMVGSNTAESQVCYELEYMARNLLEGLLFDDTMELVYCESRTVHLVQTALLGALESRKLLVFEHAPLTPLPPKWFLALHMWATWLPAETCCQGCQQAAAIQTDASLTSPSWVVAEQQLQPSEFSRDVRA